MMITVLRTNEEVKEIYDEHFDMLFRISFMYFKNEHDALDIIQNVFVKLIEKNVSFNDKNHEKAWLIRVTVNMCKNNITHWFRKNKEIVDSEFTYKDKNDDLLEQVLLLPRKYKDVIYLYYYEGYSTIEISKMLDKNENTVRSLLKRAKLILKENVKEEFYEK